MPDFAASDWMLFFIVFSRIGHHSCIVRPSAPTLSINPVRSPAGGRVDMMCDTPYPQGIQKFKWYQDGTLAAENSGGIYTISSFGSANVGKYTCSFKAGGVESLESPEVAVQVVPPPKPILFVTEHQVEAGGSSTLTCSSASYGVKWHIFKKEGNELTRLRISSYDITNFTLQDAGTHTCIVSIADTPSEESRPLMVNLKPAMPQMNASQTEIITDGNTTLTCTSSDADPKTYIWQRDGTVLTTTADSEYLLTNFKYKHQGNYTCVVQIDSVTSEPSNVVEMNLELTPPTLTVNDTAVPPGSAVTLACSSSDDGPKMFSWRRDGTYLNSSSLPDTYDIVTTGSHESTLTITDFKRSDTGTFSCNITMDNENSPDSNSEKVFLALLAKPFMNVTMTQITPGHQTILTCILPGPGAKVYTWYNDGASVAPPQAASSLTISDFDSSKAGLYECSVEINQEVSPLSNDVQLSIHDPLMAVFMSTLTVIPEGVSIKLTCDVSGQKMPSYRWLKDGQAFLETTANITYLNDFTFSDQGSYSCQVSAGGQAWVPSNNLSLTAVHKYSLCSCPCRNLSNPHDGFVSRDRWVEELASTIKKRLSVNVAHLSATERKKSSASDDRPSSVSMGFFAVSVLTLVMFLIVFSDVAHLLVLLPTKLKSFLGFGQFHAWHYD